MSLDAIMSDLRGLFKISGPTEMSQWRQLIERRAKSVLDNLGMFTLPRLGDMIWIDPEGKGYPLETLWQANWDSAPGRVTLRVQGVFGCDRTKIPDVGLDKNGTMDFWGLTRGWEWIKGVIVYHKDPTIGYGWGQRPLRIDFCGASLDELLPLYHHQIWSELGQAIDRWNSNTYQRYARITHIHQEKELMDALFMHSRMK